jgi:hypothetical protein
MAALWQDRDWLFIGPAWLKEHTVRIFVRKLQHRLHYDHHADVTNAIAAAPFKRRLVLMPSRGNFMPYSQCHSDEGI